MIYLLLLLTISICSTLPLDKTEVQHGTSKLTDGVPTPSHYLENAEEKELPQSLPSTASDVSLQFPEVHVTSEVRTVSLQISEDGMPVIRSIVNPVVFAKEKRHEQPPLEPTEVEAPLSTPTSMSVSNDSTTADNFAKARNTVVIQNNHSTFQIYPQKESPTVGANSNVQQKDKVYNETDNTTVIKINSKVYNGISRKPKRISSFNENRNQSESEVYFKHSKIVKYGEVSPVIAQGNEKTTEMLHEQGIYITKRQEKVPAEITSNKTEIVVGSTNLKNQTSQKNVKNNSSSPGDIKDKLLIEGGTVAEINSEKSKLTEELPYNDSEMPIALETREADVGTFWKTTVMNEEEAVQKDDRKFAIEKIHKEGISQLFLNSTDTGITKNSKIHSFKPEISKSNTQVFSRETPLEGSNQTQTHFGTVGLDLMDTTSLDKQVPETVLESEEKVLLEASKENINTEQTLSIEGDAGFITPNISRRNDTMTATKPGLQSDVKSSNSHMIQGVLKSRSLEPYVELYDPTPSISSNQQIFSPISEQLDDELAPGCVAAIVLGVLLCALAAMGSLAFVVYNRHSGIRPKMLSSDRSCANSDSGGYFDDQCRVAYLNSQSDVSKGTPEDLVSLDNDSFLNSLESMTIQNLWTDNIRHTKL